MAKRSSKFENMYWMADSSLVVGLIAAGLSFIPFITKAAIPLSIAGSVFGILPLVINTSGNKSKAIAGIALSVIALIVSIIVQVQTSNSLADFAVAPFGI